jgi:hypothetical protein
MLGENERQFKAVPHAGGSQRVRRDAGQHPIRSRCPPAGAALWTSAD